MKAYASGYGMGAILMLEGKPIAYMSNNIDKEALTIIEILQNLKHYFVASTHYQDTPRRLNTYKSKNSLKGIQHKLLVELLGLQ